MCLAPALNPLPVVLLSGPTASGKSKLALQMASHMPVTLINADSMQLYAGLPLLTASPSQKDLAQEEHRLYHVFPYDFQGGNVALWKNLARQEIERSLQQVKMPWVVGGTGFYLKALSQGISEMPEISPQAKQSFLQRIAHLPTEALYEQLQNVDGSLAVSLSAQDRQRICRGLLVYEQTQKPLSFWQKTDKSKALYPFLHIHLAPPRAILRERIRKRFETSLEDILAEVALFLKKPKAPSSPLRRAAGFQDIQAHLEGRLSLMQAKEQAITRVQQYAKRQDTWFRHQTNPDLIFDMEHPEKIPETVLSFLKASSQG
ncbi:MAG: tRNA (adenosine(37)-N6)-dimethylallyltransferase MiaA [Alphaproteobacteria bacterium]